MTDRYNIYSKYLKEHYGEKVYKLPIKLDLTCPNRDGRLGHGGCIYCHEEGGSFENKEKHLSIREQLEKDKQTIENKYNAHKFISYFQNYSNTYMPLEL
ncbi:MAG: TIGR01212 family radical SAM protein, partial [Finegoldia magna]